MHRDVELAVYACWWSRVQNVQKGKNDAKANEASAAHKYASILDLSSASFHPPKLAFVEKHSKLGKYVLSVKEKPNISLQVFTLLFSLTLKKMELQDWKRYCHVFQLNFFQDLAVCNMLVIF